MIANATFRPARILLYANFGSNKKKDTLIKINLSFYENGLIKKEEKMEVKINPWNEYFYEKLQRLMKDAIDDYYDGKNFERRIK